LIEGAHAGAGLGHEFLRHVERTRVLIHLVEPSPMDGTHPIDNYRTIRDELQQYDVDLADRPELIAVSKGELPGAEEVREKLAAETGREVFLFSSVTGEGLNSLMQRTHTVLSEARAAERERQAELARPRVGGALEGESV
jgi:GTP-binding protein